MTKRYKMNESEIALLKRFAVSPAVRMVADSETNGKYAQIRLRNKLTSLGAILKEGSMVSHQDCCAYVWNPGKMGSRKFNEQIKALADLEENTFHFHYGSREDIPYDMVADALNAALEQDEAEEHISSMSDEDKLKLQQKIEEFQKTAAQVDGEPKKEVN